MIRIFVGTEPKTYLAQRVLEHSIRRHTQAEVQITPMIGPDWEYDLQGTSQGTGFSLRRWMIPYRCGWTGKAIYMDADQLVFGDVNELWNIDKPYRDKHGFGNQVWCTFQADKFSKNPWPQSSVMLIDCQAAQQQSDFWTVEHAINLWKHSDNPQKHYANYMHATWMQPQPVPIDLGWNHLNLRNKHTKLLHYTKEPEQPWYKPDHPLAKHWEAALVEALKDNFVTVDDLKAALAKWNVQQDWRSTNGLHPYYAKYARTFKVKAAAEKAPPKPKLATNQNLVRPKVAGAGPKLPPHKVRALWVTTFSNDMYKTSAMPLINSFRKFHPPGELLCVTEGMKIQEDLAVKDGKVLYTPIENMPWLSEWLNANADVIPKHLGGTADGTCTCPGGPLEVHAKNHKMPCIGHWFNRNASRWFRKIVAQDFALKFAQERNYTHLMWVDSDCHFLRNFQRADVQGWFSSTAMFYLKHKREMLEAGVLGFDLTRNGNSVMEHVIDVYRSGQFRTLKRWDDCAVYQWCVDRTKVPCVDIARRVGEHARVVEYSPLARFVTHDKGRHGRKLGIMT
jgi:hypothetical protein